MLFVGGGNDYNILFGTLLYCYILLTNNKYNTEQHDDLPRTAVTYAPLRGALHRHGTFLNLNAKALRRVALECMKIGKME